MDLALGLGLGLGLRLLLANHYCAPDPEAASREIQGDAGRYREIQGDAGRYRERARSRGGVEVGGAHPFPPAAVHLVRVRVGVRVRIRVRVRVRVSVRVSG